jgi:hypothetical protein
LAHRDDDEPILDSPYTNEDLKKAGFDPFQAHLDWLARKRAVTPQQEARAALLALARIDEELEKFREEQKKPKPKPPRKPTEAQQSIKLWKAALKLAKQRRSRPG